MRPTNPMTPAIDTLMPVRTADIKKRKRFVLSTLMPRCIACSSPSARPFRSRQNIGELSHAVQVKLLRFLQEREYEPLGGTGTTKADVRIIAATNKNILEEISKGNFRDDLYYRIDVVNIKMPSLSERREDIPLLVRQKQHPSSV